MTLATAGAGAPILIAGIHQSHLSFDHQHTYYHLDWAEFLITVIIFIIKTIIITSHHINMVIIIQGAIIVIQIIIECSESIIKIIKNHQQSLKIIKNHQKSSKIIIMIIKMIKILTIIIIYEGIATSSVGAASNIGTSLVEKVESTSSQSASFLSS